MGAYRQSSLRALAPASLVIFGIAFLVVVIASLSGGDSSSSPSERVQPTKSHKRQIKPATSHRRVRPGARFYTVRPGDNLSTIAAATGVSVDLLLELNPSLDPQGLVTGQRLKLSARRGGATGASGASGATGATGPG
jgi:LysM repeat protein